MIQVISIVSLLFIGFHSDWKLEKEVEDVKVYTRSVEGHEIREFKVEAETSASLKEIDRIFRDINNYTNWMPDLITAEIIEQVDSNTYHYRMVIDTPFPVKNREIVAKMKFHYFENGFKIEHRGIPEEIPSNDEHIRIPYIRGFWEFTKIGDTVTIQNQFISDPGGSVPAWITNMFLVENPYETVTNLKEEIE